MKGRRLVKKNTNLRHETDCVCAIQRVNGEDKRLKCLWNGYGSRCQAHRFVSRTAPLLGFSLFTLNSFLCIKDGPPPKWHQSNLTSIGVHMAQYPCGTLSPPRRVLCPDELRLLWGQKKGKMTRCSDTCCDTLKDVIDYDIPWPWGHCRYALLWLVTLCNNHNATVYYHLTMKEIELWCNNNMCRPGNNSIDTFTSPVIYLFYLTFI